ncbi:hypothetical protein HYFRA_00013535 [Hymenoscyphus fraxineus]|uniref:Transcription factor Rba50 n=1 Tax=Hymenoscyphus fraxineus TaxID=746836 RepID=A0A9N9LBZ2_9HELO|nr:hypothetical protein HYFRA_00013535 [Hymenoscyphus fraxineus]
MDLRGQRFVVDLSDDEDERASPSIIPSNGLPNLPFIGDIQEREVAPPSAPKMKSTPTGFPEHKKRTRISTFKQQRGGVAASTEPKAEKIATPAAQIPSRPAPRDSRDDGFDAEERQRIDEENKQKLDAMSAEEIEEERQELMAGLNPSLIERFLRRANLDEGRGDTGIEPPSWREEDERKAKPEVGEPVKLVPAPKPAGNLVAAEKSVRFEEDEKPVDATTGSSLAELSSSDPAIHFPNPPPVKDLDPSDPEFLENLHNKYFPDLPNDPSKLAWMAPIPTHGSIADQDSPYYPAHEALPASALRFDFRGGLLPPRISRAMPSTKGLHHHGEAPEAAGYTVPELARLSRSAYPAQRCIAFQTLGRLLYRLGRGEWGDEDSEINKGLWRCVEEGKVLDTLEEAANASGGHQGSKVYAVEAVWLWQKGGGKRWKAA